MLKKEKEKQEKEKGNREADNIEKLKKYKELLDSGIISQDEFDKKKSELLNL
ncbi:MAG: SHOCT domain-containing protein [Oscillospiraceae bacterium]|nr:SHOCT domain-containing protein [Oscillospiraceae bacterium]